MTAAKIATSKGANVAAETTEIANIGSDDLDFSCLWQILPAGVG